MPPKSCENIHYILNLTSLQQYGIGGPSETQIPVFMFLLEFSPCESLFHLNYNLSLNCYTHENSELTQKI